jgi:hypothetical protein
LLQTASNRVRRRGSGWTSRQKRGREFLLRRFDAHAQLALLRGFQQRNPANLLQVATDDVAAGEIVGFSCPFRDDVCLRGRFVDPHRSP